MCEVVVKGKKRKIEKGDLLLVKPGEDYEIIIKEGQNSGDYHLLCEGEWIDDWWLRSPKSTVSRIELEGNFVSLWRQIIAEIRRPQTDQSDELMDYFLRSLCLLLERAMTEKSPSFNRPYVVTQMMRYIEEHATTSFTVDDVAKHVGLSVSRTVHLFKSYVGETIVEYAQKIRLATAIDQMRYTTLTLESIAYNCGFSTYPYFHRVFRKRYGISPGKYRKFE